MSVMNSGQWNAQHLWKHLQSPFQKELLGKPLPQGTIRFSSKVTKISKGNKQSQTEIYLDDGTTITSKVLIGCDGVHSAVAQWMGLKEPGFVGQYDIRGVAKYTVDHEFGTVSRQYLGTGTRGGIVPISSDKIYWFGTFNNPKQGWVTDPERVKEEAKILIKDWSDESKEIMHGLIDNTPPETISRSALKDRLALPSRVGYRWSNTCWGCPTSCNT